MEKGSGDMESIVVVMAMEAEAAPLVERIGAVSVPSDSPLPVMVAVAEVGGCRVAVVVNGRHPRHGVDHIGTDAAALSTAYAIDRFAPDLVISAGTAGGRAGSGHRTGDVVLAAPWFVHHDRRIPLADFDALGIGRFPAVPIDGMARSLGLGSGVFSTGNSFGETAEDLAMLDRSGAIAVDMESAAVASVAELFGVPVTGVRVIANSIDDGADGAAEFEAGLHDASARLADALVAVLDHCATRAIDDLADDLA